MVIRVLNSLLLGMVLCFFTASSVFSQSMVDREPVADIIIKEGFKAKECYELTPKMQLKDDFMPVKAGEKIKLLREDCEVRLVYYCKGCPDEMMINGKETVVRKPSSFREKKILETSIENGKDWFGTVITRMSSTGEKPSSKIFNLWPCPIDGATVLGGDRQIFFGWYKWHKEKERRIKGGEEIMLVIRRKGGKSKEELPIKAAALTPVNANFIPGIHYEWFIKKKEEKGHVLSETYSFSVLKKEDSDFVIKKLRTIKDEDEKRARIKQASYLQRLSDANPDLDLYADSLRFLGDVENGSFKGCLKLDDELKDECYFWAKRLKKHWVQMEAK